MKKDIAIICSIVLLVLLCATCKNNSVNEEYYYNINNMIKDIDFDIAKVDGSKIILYDSENEPIKEISFEYGNDNIGVETIRKHNNIVFFITGGSVDDETGVMFVNGDANSMLDGISYIKRIGGNSYHYSTAK